MPELLPTGGDGGADDDDDDVEVSEVSIVVGVVLKFSLGHFSQQTFGSNFFHLLAGRQ